MKKIQLWGVLFFVISAESAVAQQVPNGEFEVWDSLSAYDVYPENWLSLVVNTFCVPVNRRAEKSGESHSGNWAAKLESKVCVDELGALRLDEGLLYTGSVGWEPGGWSFPCQERPDHLRFYYKFHREGSDSAYVRALLFRYDTVENDISDTVAFAAAYFFGETPEYTECLLPLNYFSGAAPQYAHILFSTSKTLTEGLGNTPPHVYASPGTTFWIDDVAFSGGTIGAQEARLGNCASEIVVFPNPTQSEITLDYPAGLQPRTLILLNYAGVPCRRFDSSARVLPISGLPPGAYCLILELENRTVVKKILISP